MYDFVGFHGISRILGFLMPDYTYMYVSNRWSVNTFY